MNKNPDRPKDMDKIVSSCIDPKKTQEELPHKKAEREIIKEVFG